MADRPARARLSPEAEIFTPAKPGEILGHAEILVLRQISDSMARLWSSVDKVGTDVTDVRERVIRIEAAGLQSQITNLEQDLDRATTRIGQLESDRERRTGAQGAWAWITKETPWFLALGMALFAWFVKR